MIKDLKNILMQVHEPDEVSLVAFNMTHPLYWIWKAENCNLKDLYSFLRPFRKEHARFDIFINGQFILEKDYIVEELGNDVVVKFLKVNFAGAYDLQESDSIKIEGDIQKNEN